MGFEPWISDNWATATSDFLFLLFFMSSHFQCRAPLRVHESQTDGRLLWWMCRLWGHLLLVATVKKATAASLVRCYNGGAEMPWCPSLNNLSQKYTKRGRACPYFLNLKPFAWNATHQPGWCHRTCGSPPPAVRPGPDPPTARRRRKPVCAGTNSAPIPKFSGSDHGDRNFPATTEPSKKGSTGVRRKLIDFCTGRHVQKKWPSCTDQPCRISVYRLFQMFDKNS